MEQNLDSSSTEFEFSDDDLEFLANTYSAHVRDLAAILSGNRLKRSLVIFHIKQEYLHLKHQNELSTAGVFQLVHKLESNTFSMFRQEIFIQGSIPLHLAIKFGKCSMIQEFKEVFDDLTVKDQDGNTPLHFACLGGHKIAALALIERTSIGISMTEKTLLDTSFHTEVLRLESGRTCLISFGQNNEGNTPLHLACLHSHQVDLIMELVECEYSSIFTKNNENKFPLQVAQRY